MINTLFFSYSRTIGRKNNFYNKFLRFITKYLINSLIPLYYNFSKRKDNEEEGNFIVSLTTFPKRIDRVWIVIESILRQTLRPKKIILTLSELQFNKKKLPFKLITLEKEGYLEIIWTDDDIRSHKKYFYVMKKYPKDIVITIDDDFIYEKRMLACLYSYHKKYPDYVITNLALKRVNGNYNNWTNLYFKEVSPTYSIMQFGGSGVLYPAYSLHKDAFNKEYLLKLSPLADDLWLNAMAILNATKLVKTDYNIYPMPLIFKINEDLYNINVLENKNNEQIKNIENFYGCVFTNNYD